MPKTDAPPRILLLCENEKSAQLDRRAIREAGYPSIMVMSSGIEAAKLLAGLETVEADSDMPGIVVCSQKLGDMDSEQFCAIIRSHPLLMAFPVLLILPNASEVEQLEAIGCGASALLARPYSVDNLKKQLDALFASSVPFQKLKAAARAVDTSAFDSALSTYGVLLRPDRQPDDYFRIGLRFLESRHWNYAISAFQRALRDAQIKAEAELGMAAAFKGKGDQARFRDWLSRASETFVRAKRWQRARTAYARLLQHDADAKNPFIAEAHRLIRLKQYDEAADTLVQGLSLIPKGQTSHRFARVCFSADDPAAMFSALEAGLASHSSLAPGLLAEEISDNLEQLARERDERQRQIAAEKKWEISRKMAASRQVMEQDTARAKPELKEENAIYLLENDSIDEPAPMPGNESSTGNDLPRMAETGGDKAALAPLTRMEATSDLFEKKPKFNELLSVIKFTWKLAKRTKNRE